MLTTTRSRIRLPRALETRCKEWLSSLFFGQRQGQQPQVSARGGLQLQQRRANSAPAFPTLRSGNQFDMPAGSEDDERRSRCATESKLPHLQGEIYGWSNASFADVKSSDGSHRASSIGRLFSSNGGPISWRSTKTPLIALNVAESEIIDQSSACQETATASA